MHQNYGPHRFVLQFVFGLQNVDAGFWLDLRFTCRHFCLFLGNGDSWLQFYRFRVRFATGGGLHAVIFDAFVENSLDFVVIKHHNVGLQLWQFGYENISDFQGRQFLLFLCFGRLRLFGICNICGCHCFVSSFRPTIAFVSRLR